MSIIKSRIKTEVVTLVTSCVTSVTVTKLWYSYDYFGRHFQFIQLILLKLVLYLTKSIIKRFDMST